MMLAGIPSSSSSLPNEHPRSLRQVGGICKAACRTGPTGNLFVYRPALVEQHCVHWKPVQFLAVQFVRHADFYGFEAVENIEPSNDHRVEPVDPHRVTTGHGVEPAATSRSAGSRAELSGLFTNLLTRGVV